MTASTTTLITISDGFLFTADPMTQTVVHGNCEKASHSDGKNTAESQGN